MRSVMHGPLAKEALANDEHALRGGLWVGWLTGMLGASLGEPWLGLRGVYGPLVPAIDLKTKGLWSKPFGALWDLQLQLAHLRGSSSPPPLPSESSVDVPLNHGATLTQ